MGRLIDVDKLLEETRRDRDYARKNGFLDMYYERQVLIDRIESQPTAYSVDKVVKELEELKMRYLLTIANTGDEKSDFAYENVGNVLDKAIEIVKHGCVSDDDVCEWKMTDTKKLMPYKTSCGNEDMYDNSYKYCPYCGKKIKKMSK